MGRVRDLGRWAAGLIAWGIVLIIAVPAEALDYTWTGASSGSWGTGTNWVGGSVPPSDDYTTGLIFPSGSYGTNLNNNITGTFNLWKLSVASGAPSLNLTGNGLAFGTSGQNGIYQNSANTATVGNALSWAGTGTLSLSVASSGSLSLTGGLTTTASGTVTKLGGGSLALSGTNSLAGTFAAGGGSTSIASGSLSSATLQIGTTTPATMTISGSGTTVSVSGGLTVNSQATAASSNISTLNLQGGTLSVGGATVIGRARMDSGPANTSAQVTQSGGSLTSTGAMTIGQFGTAQSIYTASGGTLSATGGMTVGAQGNGVLNISGGSVVLDGTTTKDLLIGCDSTGATSGSVTLSSGSLSIGGDLVLGKQGIGTFSRSGGTMTASGNLVASGAGTLVLDGPTASVATHFVGQLSHTGTGTLVVVPSNNLLAGNEAITFGASPDLNETCGILGPWAVRQASATSTSGDFLTLTGTSAPYSLATASYDSTNFSSSTETSIVNVTGSPNIGDTSAYAVKFGSGTTTIDGTLTLASGGMILNGGTINPDENGGAVDFGGTTGLVYAGTSTAGTVNVPLSTSMGMVKFGPGKLILAANNASLTGGIIVTSGVLNVQDSGALGPGGMGNETLVAAGSALELEGGIDIGNVVVSLSGTGVESGGALRNVSGDNSLAGVLLLNNATQIATDSGTLSLSGAIQGNHNLTKTGTGTLALSADSSGSFTGAITVSAGTLQVSNSGALGSIGGGSGTTIQSGATLALCGGISLPAEPITLGGTGVSSGGALRNLQDNNTVAGGLSLSANTQIATDSGSLILSGPISGNYSLTKTGSGTLVLANTANSFSGALTVSAGKLVVASLNNTGIAGPLGLSSSAIPLGTSGNTTTFEYTGSGTSSNRPFSLTSGATVAYQIDDSLANLSLNGTVSGGGTFRKTGPGTLTFAGSASFTGDAHVDEGTLAVSSTGTMASTTSITVHPKAVLELTHDGTSQLSDTASISLAGSSLVFYGNGTSSPCVGETVGDLLLGIGQNDISVGRWTGTTSQPWLSFTNLPTHTIGSTVDFTATSAEVRVVSDPGVTNGILGGYAIYGGTDFATRTNSSTFSTIAAYSNYTEGNLASITSVSVNLRPTGTQTDLTSSKSFNSLNLTGSTGVKMSFVGSLTLTSGGLIANTSGGIRGGTLKGSESGELVIHAVQDIAVSSTIANNGGTTALVKTGPGTLTLSGANTFTGNTYLNEGTLLYIPPSDVSYGGVITGPSNFTKSGTYTLTLSGNSILSGDTTVTGGRLHLTGSLGSDTTVYLQTTAVLSGSGTVGGDVVVNGGSIALDSSGTIGGTVVVESGTLYVGKSDIGNYLSTTGGLIVAGSGTLTAGPSTTATLAGSLLYSSSVASTYSGTITGSNSTVSVDAPETTILTLSASNAYGGGTTIYEGTLQVGHASALGSGGVTLHGGSLDLGSLSSLTLPSLAGTGGTILTSSTSATTLYVEPDSNVSTSYAGVIADGEGTLSLEKIGEGTLVLSGTNTYSGGTTVTEGTLMIGSVDALPPGGSLSIGSGGTLILGGGMSMGQAAAAVSAVPVPEPGTWALLLIAVAGLVLATLRRRIGG